MLLEKQMLPNSREHSAVTPSAPPSNPPYFQTPAATHTSQPHFLYPNSHAPQLAPCLKISQTVPQVEPQPLAPQSHLNQNFCSLQASFGVQTYPFHPFVNSHASTTGLHSNQSNFEKFDPAGPMHGNTFPYQSGAYSGGPNNNGYSPHGASTLYNPQVSQMASQAQAKFSPMVVPAESSNSSGDANILLKALKGSKIDEQSVIQVLANRTNLQRLEIAEQYKVLSGKELAEVIKSKMSGKLKRLLLAMIMPLSQFYAKELFNAVDKIFSDKSILDQILVVLSNQEILEVTQAYKDVYGKSLENELNLYFHGNSKRLMASILCAKRDESFEIDPASAADDARKLLQAELRSNKSVFYEILVQRNLAQLSLIFEEYRNSTGLDIEQGIEKKFSDDFRNIESRVHDRLNILLAIVKHAKNKAAFYAELIYKSKKGLGLLLEQRLTRIIVTRSGIDMGEIKQAFIQQYGKTLEAFISDNFSGNYKKCLLTLTSQ
ncbi:annexin B9 [Copidosoma floridanum]|uniref:annexin B9 n=1 Tax=Copidosoma floridanum TaxID=29053 RepID=UPI0006C95A44|nr:annexin B9 [Copidosoma floridanum]